MTLEISAIIIDDEKKAREGLRGQIQRIAPEVKILNECDSVASAYEALSKSKPDVIFLDVEMLDGTGFDLLSRFEKLQFHVIFTTAYDQYAIRAFRFNAVDYLLKPIDPDELAMAIRRLKTFVGKEGDQQKQLQMLLDNLNQTQVQEQKIAISASKKTQFFRLKEIIYLTAEGTYTTIKLIDGKSVLSAKTLKHYYELLEDKGFYRVHRSNVINLRLVSEFTSRDGGMVIMENGDCIDVSNDRKKELLEQLG